MASGRVHIGTSGWSYAGWAPLLYRGVPRSRWLARASRVFSALEINGTFYGQQSAETFRRWADQTPAGFRFAIKGHRFITHYKRLRGVARSVDRLRRPAMAMGDKLAAVVWQLPANLECDLVRLRSFLATLARWPEVRHAIELRHRSWFTDEVAALLGEARTAVCIGSAPDFPMWLEATTDLVYVRLHGHTRKYASSYSHAHLRRWAERVTTWRAEGRDVHVYFDNDAEGAAVGNALELMELVGDSPRSEPAAACDDRPGALISGAGPARPARPAARRAGRGGASSLSGGR
ncbi:MAG TPA: DUF72 domain-containing protein [Kofleriaceae bacterium]|nr:DUF72 domain-containing protein [Kofleriaceae bacterium]